MSRPVLLTALLGTLAACSSGAEPPPAVAAARPAPLAAHAAVPPTPGARARLVFFINPNGGPCQIQDRILRDMSGELSQRVEVVYYRTTDPADLAWFQRYGIRSLPQLVLTDATGRELRRATPGIQGPDQIRGLVAL